MFFKRNFFVSNITHNFQKWSILTLYFKEDFTMDKEQIERLRLIAAELVGTFMLASAVLVVSNMFGLGTAAWYTTLSAGATLALLVGIFGNVSGTHVNPAVTIGLWTLKEIDTVKAVLYIAAQMLGGALALVFYNYVADVPVLASGSSSLSWSVFLAEALGAALFGMGILAAISHKLDGFYKSFVIGGSLSFSALFASIAAPGFLNPAVALGNNFWDKTVVVAPVIGMIVGMNFYRYVFVPVKKNKK